MAKVKIQTTKEITPKIYAYTTPEIKRHEGWTKIGYTEREVEQRVKEQTQTVDVEYNIEWWGVSKFEGSDKIFRDTEFHLYLRKQKYEQEKGKDNEWFKIDGETSKKEFNEFKKNKGNLICLESVPYHLREEQEKAVIQTKSYFEEKEKGEYLWNAKPRFGKTLSVYDFCKQIGAKKVLIVTNRPAIANSWYDDYVKFMGDKSGYKFVSSTDALKAKKGEEDKYKYVISRDKFIDEFLSKNFGCIEFVSLQDLKGSIYFGGKYDKLREVKDLEWDLLVVDEAHEGVDTYKTDVAFEQIKRHFTLHLSGTPFKALANDKFEDRAIFNWTYADEQRSKKDWEDSHNSSIDENPYGYLPMLNLYTYQMSEIIKDEISRGIDLDGKTEEYAFDLNEFFATNSKGEFEHDTSVDKFIDSLVTLEKMPFSTEDMREELRHTFWLLNRVDSAKALKVKLDKHPIFSKYEVILAAGDGKIDDDDENEKSYNRVINAIKAIEEPIKEGKKPEKFGTITISVGQLTTGVTIPEWTGVLMLSNLHSPSLYMQAAFRAQNPCLYEEKGHYYRKENAYVFDFDPARTLTVFEEFANDLYSNTKNGRGTVEERKERIYELLNFFPVIGEDEEGKMELLDAEKVLTIPRKIRSKEVVNRGFMSDFLFQNISNIFHAPTEIIEMIQNFPAYVQPNAKVEVTETTSEELNLDEKGEVSIDDKYVIGKCADCFGEKHYGISKNLADKIARVQIGNVDEKKKDKEIKEVQQAIKTMAIDPILNVVQEKYGKDLTSRDKNRLIKEHAEKTERAVNKVYAQYNIDMGTINADRKKQIEELSRNKEQDVLSLTDKRNENISALKDLLKERKIDKVDFEKKKEEIESDFTVKKQAVENNFEQKKQKVNSECEEKKQIVSNNLISAFKEETEKIVESVEKDSIKRVEENVKNAKKKGIETIVKDHLRGFSRTIPSFLMAYGDENTTLENFDKIVPADVFEEVTGITLEKFRFLRDGGKYEDESTGELKEFAGHLFDEVVFNDSVKEFLSLKDKLSNYFDGSHKEDIFDYIPPQKNNQIYTPKKVVKEMVDMLEENNPGCFDDDTHTFLDCYMKSGLFITEVVTRLFKSESMQAKYPNREDRLKHIFENQVFGIAPSQIIYDIAMNFILGFDKEKKIGRKHFRMIENNVLISIVQEGKLEEKLAELFGE